MARKLQRKL